MDISQVKEKILESIPGILSTTNLGTKKYKHVQSWDLVEAFSKIGYEVLSWDMQKSKRNGSHAPHMIEMVLTSTQYKIKNEIIHPQIVILNSYNAKQALRIKFGIFYSQGHKMSLLIGDALEGSRIVHMGEKVDKLVQDIHEDITRRMTELNYETYLKPLSNEEKVSLTKSLLKTRFNTKADSISVSEMLTPISTDDQITTAWDVYQTVVERILRGLYIINRRNEDGYKFSSQMQGKATKKFTVSGYWQGKLLDTLKKSL